MSLVSLLKNYLLSQSHERLTDVLHIRAVTAVSVCSGEYYNRLCMWVAIKVEMRRASVMLRGDLLDPILFIITCVRSITHGIL